MTPLKILMLPLALLVAVSSAPVAAEKPVLPPGVEKAFSPIRGYVVSSRGNGYLVDLGSRDGLIAGDLLAVLGPIKTFTHPVTGEPVEGLPSVDSVLRVTRVEENIALSHPLVDAAPPRVGAPVQRYGGLKAGFLDHTGSGDSLYLALRQALPHLDWRPHGSVTATGEARARDDSTAPLLFELRADRLLVRGAGAELIRSYPLSGNQAETSTQKAQRAAAASAPGRAGEAYRPEYSRAAPVVNLSGGVRIADLLTLDGRLLMASTDGYRIRVHAFDDDGQIREQSVSDAIAGELVSLHWWQPEGTRKIYLATTGWNGDRALGTVFELRGDRLVAAVARASYILASFDTDGDGRRETLLGQSYEREGFFGPRVQRLALSGDALVARDNEFPLPRRFTVQGATFADLTGDGRPELAFIRDRVLHIYSPGGELLYRSTRQMGGSLSWVQYETDPEFDFSPVTVVPFELPPVPVDLDGDGVQELVTIAADLSLLSLPGAGPGVKKSWLAIFEYRDGQIVKGRLGPDRDLPVQGLAATEGEILLVTPTSTSIVGHSEESQIIAVPVDG